MFVLFACLCYILSTVLFRNLVTDSVYVEYLEAMGSARNPIIQASLREAAALAKYAANLAGCASDFESLSLPEKSQFLPDLTEDVVSFLLSSGWDLREFCIDLLGRNDEPNFKRLRPALRNPLKAFLNQKGPSVNFVEHELLDPYPIDQSELRYGNRTHLGHVFHGMVSLCRKYVKAPWSERVCIVRTKAQNAMAQIELHRDTTIVLAVVESEEHWGLVATARELPSSVLFDGLANYYVAEKSEAWSQQLQTALTTAEVPTQPDSWSCGHRLLLAVQHILVSLKQGHWPTFLPEDFATEEKIMALVAEDLVPIRFKDLIVAVPDNPVKAELKREAKPEPQQESRKRVKVELKKEPEAEPWTVVSVVTGC